MSPFKRDRFTNLPTRQSPRLKALTANSPSKNSSSSNSWSSSSIKIKSEPSDCEESTSSSFSSKQNNKYSSDDEWGSQEMISLKDLRAKCRAKKRRKNTENPELESGKTEVGKWNSESDLDEPLIVLKVCKKRKNKGVNVISQCVDSSVSQTGLAEEKPKLNEETFPIQSDCSATSVPNTGTITDSCTSDLIHKVKTEPSDQIEISDTSIHSSNLTFTVKTEILENKEDQIEILEKEGNQIEVFEKDGDQIEILEREDQTEFSKKDGDQIDILEKGDQIEILEKEDQTEILEKEGDQIENLEKKGGQTEKLENKEGDEIEISEKDGDQTEILEKGGDQSEVSPSKVDFIAKFDSSSPNKSSFLILSANENLPSGETLSESCDEFLELEEQFDSPEIIQKELDQSEIVEKESDQFEGEKSKDVISENSKVDCVNVMDVCTEEKGCTDNGFLCEEAHDFLDISSFGSTDGQLESIVYNAINCLNNNAKNNDNNFNNEIISNSDEESEKLNLVKVLEMKSNGGLQLCDNLEKEKVEKITENGGAELQTPNENEEMTRQEPAPIKLLSNRNIISPTSQDKLCQALTGIDICEGAEFSKCRKRIMFENWTKAKKPSAEPTTQNTPRNFHKPRGVFAKRSNGNNSPVKMDTQKAIEFSQRQMQDFENISNKLLKSMKFMKNVLDESLLAVDSPPILSKFSFSEIKAASDNASELDKMTRKWLTIMSKDCNRFCKILKSAGDTPSPDRVNNNNIQNKRRKIVFADEAGGVLCDVRVFSQPEPEQ